MKPSNEVLSARVGTLTPKAGTKSSPLLFIAAGGSCIVDAHIECIALYSKGQSQSLEK